MLLLCGIQTLCRVSRMYLKDAVKVHGRTGLRIDRERRGSPGLPKCRNGSRFSTLSRGYEEEEYAGVKSIEKETVDVRCGGSGNITIDLFNPSVLLNPSTPLILYFPPSGIHLSHHHPPVPTYLFQPDTALACINYRWNNSPSVITPQTPLQPSPLTINPSSINHAFPTPLHDTLHAYTRLLTHFTTPTPAQNSPPPTPRRLHISSPPPPSQKYIQRPILIYGSYLGGTLATSLALTESFASKSHPARIAGLISKSAVYDWVEAGTSPTPTHHQESEDNPPLPYSAAADLGRNWDLKTLITARERLFSTPGGTFDAFASPVLFFRTAGAAVPRSWTSLDPNASPSPSPSSSASTTSSPEIELDIWDDYDEKNGNFLTSSKGKPGGELGLDAILRKNNLKFPPRDSGLKLPRSLFLFDNNSVGRKKGEEEKQALEMARLMRRSVVVNEFKDRVLWDEDLNPVAVSEQRVQVEDSTEEEIVGVRNWIEEAIKINI